MIKITDSTLQKRIANGEAVSSEIADYLIKHFSVWDIALALADNLNQEITPINITQAQLEKYFKVIGQRKTEDGETIPETRGRKKKIQPNNTSL